MSLKPTIPAAQLREARAVSGLSLEEASAGICSPSYLSLLEAGKRKASVQISTKLAHRFGLSFQAGMSTAAPSMAFDLVLAALVAGELDYAERNLETVMDPVERKLLTGRLKTQRFQFDDAITTLRAVESESRPRQLLNFHAGLTLTYALRNAGYLLPAIQVGEKFAAMSADIAQLPNSLRIEMFAVLASIYKDTGDLSRARQLTELSMQSAVTTWEKIMGLWASASLEEVVGNYAKAREAAETAASLAHEFDNSLAEARLNVISATVELQDEKPNLKRVAERINNAESVLRAINLREDLAWCLAAKAELASFGKDHKLVRDLFDEVFGLLKDVQHESVARILAESARSYIRIGELELAKQSLLDSRALLEKQGARRSEASVWTLMGNLYEELGEPVLALSCMKSATELLGLQSRSLVDFQIEQN